MDVPRHCPGCDAESPWFLFIGHNQGEGRWDTTYKCVECGWKGETADPPPVYFLDAATSTAFARAAAEAGAV